MSDFCACQVVGFGPACTSFLISADRCGILIDMLKRGLNIYESAMTEKSLAKKGINYDILSNSDASDFLDGISPYGIFSPVLKGGVAEEIKSLRNEAVPLTLIAKFIEQLRQRFLTFIESYPTSNVYYNTNVDAIKQGVNGWLVMTSDKHIREIESDWVVFACGSQPFIPAKIDCFADMGHIPLFHSETFLRASGTDIFINEISQCEKNATVVIVGGSHSAFSVLDKLLSLNVNVKVTLIHSQPIRRMHIDQSVARSQGEEFDSIKDVCPDNGRVFRFQGLYKQSKQLFEEIKSGRHPQVKLCQNDNVIDALATINNIHSLICATGYRPRIPAIKTAREENIGVDQQGSRNIVINRQGKLMADNGSAVGGVLGIGLGWGRQYSGIGEPSYKGAPVGINIFQTADGDALCQELSRVNHTTLLGDNFEQQLVKEMG